MAAATDLYLPDECWEHIFKFLNCYGGHYYNTYLESLSIVSKQFLSITNRLRSSLIIHDATHPFLGRLFQRFPNLTLVCFYCFMQFIQTNHNSNFLMDFVVSPQLKLKYLHLPRNYWLRNKHIKMFPSIFPNLQLLDLSYCCYISREGICEVLKRCCKIRHLNLTCCCGVKLRRMNFEAPKLKVLYMSQMLVDDDELYVISKSCPNLLQLDLEHCRLVTDKGLKHVLENCTQLRELNLRNCHNVHHDVLASLILSRSSLRKLTIPYGYPFISHQEMKLLSRQRQGCIVC